MSPISFHDFEQQGWQRAAERYAGVFGPLTSQSIDALLTAVRAGPDVRLLDVACGPGFAAAAAARRGSTVVGVDFAPEMIALARNLNPGVEFIEGDAQNLNLPSDAFDAVIINYGMLHFDNPERAAAESWRVLTAGGRFAFTVWDSPDKAVAFDIVLTAIQKHGTLDVGLPEGPPFFRFSDSEECRAVLSAAGFVDIETQRVPQIWRLESADALFTTMRDAAVRTGAILRMQTPQATAAIRNEIKGRAERFRRNDVIELPMPAVLTSAVKPGLSARHFHERRSK